MGEAEVQEPWIEIAHLSAGFETRVVLRGLSLAVPRLGILGLMGPAGVGKSTLLRTLARWNEALPSFWYEGDVRIEGRSLLRDLPLAEAQERVTLLAQKARLFTASVLDNVTCDILPIGAPAGSREERREGARGILEPFGLWEEMSARLDLPISHLSIAEQRRLSIARLAAGGFSCLLADEPLRLARMLTQLAPAQPEAWGLQALLEIQASRSAARIDAQGEPVLLAEQDRQRWDRLLIRRGLDALAQAERLAAQPGSYQLQAAIAACHARAARAEDTDWARIAALYAELMRVAPSPVVELNRAVAVSMHQGPAAGLAIVERLSEEPALARYHWLPAVRGDLLAKLGRHAEARQALLAAAALAGNERERTLLRGRAAAVS